MAEGHTMAMSYPLGFMWTEVKIVRQRLSSSVKMQALIQQSVIASVLNSKTGGKALKELLDGLDDGYNI